MRIIRSNPDEPFYSNTTRVPVCDMESGTLKHHDHEAGVLQKSCIPSGAHYGSTRQQRLSFSLAAKDTFQEMHIFHTEATETHSGHKACNANLACTCRIFSRVAWTHDGTWSMRPAHDALSYNTPKIERPGRMVRGSCQHDMW